MNKPKIKKLLKLPDNYIVPYAITVGYPSDQNVACKKKKIEGIVLLVYRSILKS